MSNASYKFRPLIEVFNAEESKLEVIKERYNSHADRRLTKVKGRFHLAEEKNRNRRVYKKALLEREMHRIMPLVKTRSLYGEVDHPDKVSTSLMNTGLVVTELNMNCNEIQGTYEILPTPAGKVLEGLYEANTRPGISSRGGGSLIKDGDGYLVADDYRLVTWDAVADPSTYGAYPALVKEAYILESSEMDFVNRLDTKTKNSLVDVLDKENKPTSYMTDPSRLAYCFKDNKFVNRINDLDSYKRKNIIKALKDSGYGNIVNRIKGINEFFSDEEVYLMQRLSGII